ncbi:fimbrial protein [Entomohabitans teleogrylli]|uniref:fimbrial protein n=1 Tax=Entomohabitans teleogrylli TaxID=1384589 RepID=UPI00073D2FF6|nr:fimbrial protein [Entomohabitans teleogrylli]
MMMETGKKISLSLCLSTLLFSAHALSTNNVTPGELAISGEIIAAACDIDPNSREMWVAFDDVTARDIHMNAENKLIKPIKVHLTGCSPYDSGDKEGRYPYATITFTGNAAANDPTVLMPDGEGKGFGIRLHNQHGSVLTFGQPSPGYELSDGQNILRFTASLVPVHQHIQAGDFYAVARFYMDYN